MRLIEALAIINRESLPGTQQQHVFLACGITPLHLQTFLTAHLRRIANDPVIVETGLFGDLAGSLANLDPTTLSAAAVVIEWADLDPRLGFRRLSGWRSSELTDILASVNDALGHLRDHLARIARITPTVVSMPTLPLPPLAWNRPYQASGFDLTLGQVAACFAASLGEIPGIRLLQQDFLAKLSPPGERYDFRSDLASGFPYTIAHASHLADLLSTLITDHQPKKGIITDLDGTLWAGILGEDGVEGISWSLEHHTHQHGLYQQMLASLASAGTLVAVASKNNPAMVERAFERKDLCVSSSDIFPFEVHWSRKSESVERILKTWNIGADSVVFIDDRPEEVAEVQAAHPQMECIVFPAQDHSALLNLLQHLREVFGKSVLTAEDAIRLSSLRASHEYKHFEVVGLDTPADHARKLAASVSFARTHDHNSARGHDLLNKTNQFNLNGRRWTEAEWQRLLRDRDSVVLLVSYKDKFGPLGTIATIVGRIIDDRFVMDAWAMSCRAFARYIEHHCLKYLFDVFPIESIKFDFQATQRNAPLQDFLTSLIDGDPTSGVMLSRDDFFSRAPYLDHPMDSIHMPETSNTTEYVLPR